MLEIAIGLYCIYFLINVYTVFMQIDYVKKARLQSPVILTASKFRVAGDYGVEPQHARALRLRLRGVLHRGGREGVHPHDQWHQARRAGNPDGARLGVPRGAAVRPRQVGVPGARLHAHEARRGAPDQLPGRRRRPAAVLVWGRRQPA